MPVADALLDPGCSASAGTCWTSGARWGAAEQQQQQQQQEQEQPHGEALDRAARLDVAVPAVALGDAPGEALDRAARLGVAAAVALGDALGGALDREVRLDVTVAAVALGDAPGEALDREARLDGAVAAVELLDLHVLDILQPAVAPVNAPVGHPECVEIGPKAHDGAAGV